MHFKVLYVIRPTPRLELFDLSWSPDSLEVSDFEAAFCNDEGKI